MLKKPANQAEQHGTGQFKVHDAVWLGNMETEMIGSIFAFEVQETEQQEMYACHTFVGLRAIFLVQVTEII